MAITVVRLGSERGKDEGLRVGTVRRPPRGVPKTEFSSRDFYDVWLPNISPSPETMKLGQAAKTAREWQAFEKRYRAEMARPDNLRIIELLVAFSRKSEFSIGCYCQDETRCHRSVLAKILAEKGAVILDPSSGNLF